ncbi:hypothetical protein HanRHA438_Chr12g0562921 [Helianthus annuus]|nr:hypothetical protein HanRHA438_Chr12g0562921 [Helianthus annuus]
MKSAFCRELPTTDLKTQYWNLKCRRWKRFRVDCNESTSKQMYIPATILT